ncbi:MAG: FecR domain-containing protein [Rhodocyclaceae bacterium]|nr:FecR domain-containing protein [Rhodocyclaceae bacterium]
MPKGAVMRSQYGLRRLVAVALVLFALPAFAGVGIITHLSGVLTAKRADGTSKVLGIKSEVEQGDTLTTEADTYARIKFVDGAEVVLRPGTQFKIEKYAYTEGAPDSDNIIVSMFKGGLRAVTGLIGKRNKEKVSFQTPTATIGIRGTHFGMLLCNNDCANVPTIRGVPPPDGLHVDVANGAVLMRNAGGFVVVNTGQFGFAAGQQVPPVLVPPEQGQRLPVPNAIRRNQGSGDDIGGDGSTSCGV